MGKGKKATLVLGLLCTTGLFRRSNSFVLVAQATAAVAASKGKTVTLSSIIGGLTTAPGTPRRTPFPPLRIFAGPPESSISACDSGSADPPDSPVQVITDTESYLNLLATDPDTLKIVRFTDGRHVSPADLSSSFSQAAANARLSGIRSDELAFIEVDLSAATGLRELLGVAGSSAVFLHSGTGGNTVESFQWNTSLGQPSGIMTRLQNHFGVQLL